MSFALHVGLINPTRPAPIESRKRSSRKQLTIEQLRFGRGHLATAGLRSSVLDGVFFYRRGERGTYRWLVGRDGRVLDEDLLR